MSKQNKGLPVQTYRIFLLEKYLDSIEKPYTFLNANCILIDLPEKNSILYIAGSLTAYKIRIDIMQGVDKGCFWIEDFLEETPRSLMFHLVARRILNGSFLPSLAPFPYAD